METERVSYRWWVLINTFLIFAVAFGMGWTYIVMLVSPILFLLLKETGPRVRLLAFLPFALSVTAAGGEVEGGCFRAQFRRRHVSSVRCAHETLKELYS